MHGQWIGCRVFPEAITILWSQTKSTDPPCIMNKMHSPIYRFNIGTHLNKGCSNKNGECGQEHKGQAPLYNECDCTGCQQQCKVLDQQGDAISNCSPHSWRISRETSCYFPTVVLVHIKPANLISQYACQQQFFFGMICWMFLNTKSITTSPFSSYF